MKNQNLAKEVQQAELGKTPARISKANTETEKAKAETKKLAEDMDARLAEMRKINAEAAKAQKETRYYPITVMISTASAVVLGVILSSKYLVS